MGHMRAEEEEALAMFRAHMEECMRIILAPMGNPLAQVTIILRAPEASPAEAMISTNASADLSAARSAIDHLIQARAN